MEEITNIINKYNILNLLINEDFNKNIKLLYFFDDEFNDKNVFIVTKDDKTYVYGSNARGVLGMGNDKRVNKLEIVGELCHKDIIDVKSSYYHMIARTIDGKVYCWGSNACGVLGNGREENCDVYYRPKLNELLKDEHIIDICCGVRHTLVLTSNGVVYGWGDNTLGQIGNGCYDNVLIPYNIIQLNDYKVKTISCGSSHSMVLTDSGFVFSWGNNECGELGLDTDVIKATNTPLLVSVNAIIDKISCGRNHNLMLSRDRDIYVFGSNEFGQLGLIKYSSIPIKLEIPHKFINISAHYIKNLSIALSEDKIVYIWGNCGKYENRIPYKTHFKSEIEVFAHYFKITPNTIDLIHLSLKINSNGKYRQEFIENELIATSNSGIVCEARNKINNQLFAIKKISFGEKFYEKFSQEIDILPKLREDKFLLRVESAWIEANYIKPNFYINYMSQKRLSPTDAIFNPNNKYLLHIQMELCWKSLSEVIQILNEELNRKLSQVMTPLGYYISSELFIEILESVDYLHKQNLIHRDLKPENILLTDGQNGRFIKIADFGSSVFQEFVSQSYTTGWENRGYTAPEVSIGKYDTKSDIYSLGVIVQELFNININEPIGHNTELENKYSKLFDINKRMISGTINKRPNCEEILNVRNEWALSLSELQINKEFRAKRKKYNEELFHKRFIRIKQDKCLL